MKYCNQCGAEMPDVAKFCGECGYPLENGQGVQQRDVYQQPMSQPTYQQQPQPTTVIIQSQTNGLGAAGFVVSLIGLFTFYIPVFGWIIMMTGIFLSGYGKKKEPKGLAVAGTVISVINVILWLLSRYMFKSIINSLLDVF